MANDVVPFLTMIVSLIVIVMFAILFGIGIVKSLKTGTPASMKPEMVYVATALAGLIGTGVAKSFGQKLPDPPTAAVLAQRPTPPPPVDLLISGNAVAGLFKPSFEPVNPRTIPDTKDIRFTAQVSARLDEPKEVPGAAWMRKMTSNLRAIMLPIYAVTYFLYGFVAILVWCFKGESETHQIVKNLACVTLGLFVSIAGSSFS